MILFFIFCGLSILILSIMLAKEQKRQHIIELRKLDMYDKYIENLSTLNDIEKKELIKFINEKNDE